MPGDSDRWKQNRVVYRRRLRSRQALLNRRRLLILGGVIALVLLAVGVYKLLHLPEMQILEFDITGGETKTRAAVLAYLRERTAGDWWNFIPRDNILLFSSKSAEREILRRFPAVRTAEIEKSLFHTVRVKLAERESWAIFCTGSSAPSPAAQSCFYIDRSGILFSEAPVVEGNLILTVLSDQPPQALGHGALRPGEVAELESIIREFKDRAGLVVTGFELKQNAPKDYWARVGDGFQVIVARGDPYRTVAEIVRAVLTQEIKDQRKRLEYIDARFGNKVFYKYK